MFAQKTRLGAVMDAKPFFVKRRRKPQHTRWMADGNQFRYAHRPFPRTRFFVHIYEVVASDGVVLVVAVHASLHVGRDGRASRIGLGLLYAPHHMAEHRPSSSVPLPVGCACGLHHEAHGVVRVIRRRVSAMKIRQSGRGGQHDFHGVV